MTFKPLGKRILVERNEEATTTATGIIIPDNAKEKSVTGKVLAIGDKIESKGLINVGDVVLYGKYAGTEVTVGGKDLLVLTDADIMGIMA